VARTLADIAPGVAERQRVRHLEGLLDNLEKKHAEILGSQYKLQLPKAPKLRTSGGYLRVIVSDLHGQQMDPAAFAAFVSDVGVIKPSQILLLGDWIDCGGWLSEHPTLHLGETEGSFADDIAAGHQTLNAIQAAAPKAEIIYLEGNHEWRILKTMIKLVKGHKGDAEMMKRLWGIKRLLNLDERGIRFVPHDVTQDGLRVRGAIKLGDWLFSHGPFKSCGKTALDRNLSRLKCNFAQGHIHRFLHATQQSAGQQMLHGYAFGCLCQMAPLYMENNPTDWGHGYGLQEVNKDGTATTWPVAIEDGVSRLSSLVKRLGVA
jgi:hypothetical protein